MAQKYDINNQILGDTYSGVKFTYLLNGSPLDLTNSEIKIQFRHQSKKGTLVKSLSLDDGISLTDAQNGIFTIEPFVIDMPVGKNYYDIQMTLNDDIKTYVEGVFEVLQDVTKNG